MSAETDRRHSSRSSDRELLLSISRDLRRVYAQTLLQPLPKDMEALLLRIGYAKLQKQ